MRCQNLLLGDIIEQCNMAMKKGKLEKLEKKLYSRNTPDIIDKGRTEFKRDDEEVENLEETKEIKEKWQDAKASGFDELATKVSNMAQKNIVL